MEEQCELAIIGAGYAAISAFNAAAKYLPLGSTVVIVDRGTKWGGQFTTQYDYVRLHQPYQQFTAGEREWAIAKVKPPTYLATKMEILSTLMILQMHVLKRKFKCYLFMELSIQP